MNSVTKVLLIGFLVGPTSMESSTSLQASSQSIKAVRWADYSELPLAGYGDLSSSPDAALVASSDAPALPILESSSSTPDRSTDLVPSTSQNMYDSAHYLSDERAKKLIKAVVGNDDTTFTDLFNSMDPLHQRNFAHLRFSIKDHQYITPLAVAAKNGNLHIVKALVEQGIADVHEEVPGGVTPLLYAQRQGHKHVEKYLNAAVLADEQSAKTISAGLDRAYRDGDFDMVNRIIQARHRQSMKVSQQQVRNEEFKRRNESIKRKMLFSSQVDDSAKLASGPVETF